MTRSLTIAALAALSLLALAGCDRREHHPSPAEEHQHPPKG